MPTTIAALNVLIFLLPGFLILRIVEGLTVTGKASETARIVDALALSLVNYIAFTFLIYALNEFRAVPLKVKPIPLILSPDGQLQFTGSEAMGFLLLILIAVLISAGYAAGLNRGWIYSICREKLHLTRKTGRVDLWHDVCTDFRGRWIQVYLKNGTRIIGWPDYYSDNPEKRELFLAEAVVTKADGGAYEVSGPGILLTEKAEIERIEVLD